MRCRRVSMRDRAAEQAAPTIHQSLIRNNSTADSSHGIVPLYKQAISLPDCSPGLYGHHRQCAYMHVCQCLCVSKPAAIVCYPYCPKVKTGCCVFPRWWWGQKKKSSFDVSEEAVTDGGTVLGRKEHLYSRLKSYTKRQSDRPPG